MLKRASFRVRKLERFMARNVGLTSLVSWALGMYSMMYNIVGLS